MPITQRRNSQSKNGSLAVNYTSGAISNKVNLSHGGTDKEENR